MVINVDKLRANDAMWLYVNAGKEIVLTGGSCEHKSIHVTANEVIKR